MEQKLNYAAASPDALNAVMKLSMYVQNCGLEQSLQELVKIRASQINGCAACLHMHARDARAAGETEERLYLLSAWREASVYTPRERAALAWTEALTRLAGHTPPADGFDEVREHFTDDEMVKLAVLIGMINVWNRLNVGFGVRPDDIDAMAA